MTPETFHFAPHRKKPRFARRREGSYLLPTNINSSKPGELWRMYLHLVEIEQVLKELKKRPVDPSDLSPIGTVHRSAYLHRVLGLLSAVDIEAKAEAAGARADAESRDQEICGPCKMIDVELPTTDDRLIVLSRYTEKERDQQLLLQ